MAAMTNIILTKPDDWHCHLRSDAYLLRTVNDTASRFQRALIMPNLAKPITNITLAEKYRDQILKALTVTKNFTPLMTLYLTESMETKTLRAAKQSHFIIACKLYPKGATTLSDKGVHDLEKIYPLLDVMQEEDLVLCIHGESTAPEDDIFDREKIFIETHLSAILKRFPRLRIVLEHISTKTAVDFIRSGPNTLAATITAHHLWYNRNALLTGGIHPHNYCLPILKRRSDQEALIQAATSGNSKFFLGSDSAPHPQKSKESACGCAGIYTAHAAIELYAQIFSESDALPQLESFASFNGANFYQVPINQEKITLSKTEWQIPETLSFGHEIVIPFLAGHSLEWKIE